MGPPGKKKFISTAIFLSYELELQEYNLRVYIGWNKYLFRHGVRNSLLIAPMPTASTAQILGNNESIEPYTSNIYTRRVLSGEFQVNLLKLTYRWL